jgi:diguanylate cyclase (GGDEF)-like protein
MFERFKFKSENLEERVKELEREVVELEHNLIHDPLTGLKTRAFFEEEIKVYLEIIEQQSQSLKLGSSQRKERFGFRHLSVIFFDIDHFKKVNDKHGHDVGDKVLKRVALTIQTSVRTGDTVARWGGEEIVVSLLGANEKDATSKAEEIRAEIEELKFKGVPRLEITISAGVASSEIGVDLSELVKRADQSLYKAKESGRNRVITYSSLSTVPEAA